MRVKKEKVRQPLSGLHFWRPVTAAVSAIASRAERLGNVKDDSIVQNPISVVQNPRYE